MIQTQCFECNMLAENCFVVSDETKECVIIDCGAYFTDERKKICDYIRGHELKPVHLLCTHGHLDHIFGNEIIYDEFGLLPEIGKADDYLISDVEKQARDLFGTSFNLRQLAVSRWLEDGDVITFGQHQLQAIATPGHTPGCMVFYCQEEHVAFTGDTVFRMSIGRTDFPRGSFEQMLKSLQKLSSQLNPQTVLYTGHGPQSTIADEARYNPYFRSKKHSI